MCVVGVQYGEVAREDVYADRSRGGLVVEGAVKTGVVGHLDFQGRAGNDSMASLFTRDIWMSMYSSWTSCTDSSGGQFWYLITAA